MRKPRRAKLTVKRTTAVDARVGLGYVSLVGSNGKRLMTSEVYDTTGNAKRARGDILDAMADVLLGEGYVVVAPSQCMRCGVLFVESGIVEGECCPKCLGELRSEAVTKAEEASR